MNKPVILKRGTAIWSRTLEDPRRYRWFEEVTTNHKNFAALLYCEGRTSQFHPHPAWMIILPNDNLQIPHIQWNWFVGIAKTDLNNSFLHMKWRQQNLNSRGYSVCFDLPETSPDKIQKERMRDYIHNKRVSQIYKSSRCGYECFWHKWMIKVSVLIHNCGSI